jgi:hypothetical protein
MSADEVTKLGQGGREQTAAANKMAWFVYYWDEINNRNIPSSEISAREDAMRKACSLNARDSSSLTSVGRTVTAST